MPRFDGTGPAGMGPMTGGRRGRCNPYSAPYGGYRPYDAPYSAPPVASYPYGRGRPRWGRGQGFWGRGLRLGQGRSWGLGRGRGR
jgi:hypothetical protein